MPNAILDKLETWQRAIIAYGDGPSIPPVTGLPLHRFGVHLINSREADLQYIERLRPAAVKIVDPDPAVVRRVLAAVGPNTVVVLRDHPMSEQKAAMAANPTGTGLRHALDWREKLRFGRFAEFGGDPRIVVVGINEPDVHNVAEEITVLKYTLAFLETLTANNIRALALNLSVGWPRNSGAETPPIWDTFLPLEKVILDGNHFLAVHEYWYPDVKSGWSWYGNRISHCPMSVPVIIGECGYTRQLANLPQPWGWRGNVNPASYAEQLWYYHDHVDPNVFAIMPFTTGYASPEWESKDTQPAHEDILARVRAYPWPTVWPVQKTPPVEPPVEPPIEPPGGDEMYKLLWPEMVRITQWFGQTHSGLDISMRMRTPLYAMWDGVVAWSARDTAENGGYGEYIRVRLNGLQLDQFIAHCDERLVQTGQTVKRGQLIAYSGNTGNSTGPHLHLEIRTKLVDGIADRAGVSAFNRGQIDPLSVKWTLANLYGFDEA